MDAPHRYPVGVQVFEDIRTMGYLYVDKTAYLHRMVTEGGSYYFLSRPRRFGKTLLVSTMEAYFQGRRELFRGLDIDTLEPGEWRRSPVLRFDMSTVKTMTVEGFRAALDAILRGLGRTWGGDDSAAPYSARIGGLVRRARESAGGERAVILVDEYDAPALNALHDPELLRRFREVMREFYAPFKSLEADLRFCFLTGISKFSQLSIFSELNNLQNISMMPQYAGICGITAEELDRDLGPDVAFLAGRLGVDEADCREALRERYDGYHFSHVSPDVYNPFSLVTAFNTGEPGSHWFSSGTPTALVNMLRTHDMAVPELEGVVASERSFDAPTESMGDPVAFMYQSGYLTIKGYDPRFRAYTLGIPNAEVAEGLYGALLPACTGSTGAQADGFVTKFSRAAFSGDMDKALHLMRSFLAGIPYDMAPKNEKDFQTIVYLVFKLVGANVATEVRTATGCVDVTIDVPDALFVMELKYSRPDHRATAGQAIDQVRSKGYLIPYESVGKPIVKVGTVYSEEERTLMEGWIIE